jgi:adenine-specific DNA-methyltransferase
MAARSLLTDDGVLFISMNDCEQRNLRNICDEIFGETNFITQLIWQQRKGGGNDSRFVATDHEYVLVYTKNIFSQNEKWKVSQSEEYQKRYNLTESNGQRYYWDTLVRNGLQNPIIVKLTSPGGDLITLNSQWSQERVENGLKDGTVRFTKTPNGWSLHHKVYLKGGQVLRSLLTEVGTNKTACDEQVSLLGSMLFDYPKPSTLIRCLGELASKKDSIILDFFSGSASTAHAVMQLNAEDGGKRKFIMVQLPEATDEKSEAYKAGYKNICEIGKERIRRAGKKIKEEHPEAKDLDIGFRVLRLDESNFEDVERTPKEYNQDQLELFLNNVKSDRNDLDLLFGCMLNWGVKLDYPMTTEEVDGKTIYTVNDGDLVACFAENVTDNVVKAMADKQPLRVIFRDSCFEKDADKINIYETFKQLLDWSDQEVISKIRVI